MSKTEAQLIEEITHLKETLEVYGRSHRAMSKWVIEIRSKLATRSELLHKAYIELEQYAKECGPCEHDIGICVCDLTQFLDSIEKHFREED